MTAYYNEHDPYVAQWLRNLISAGLIAPGDVDERDIQRVSAEDLRGYSQCHFFAGIGGWSYALRLACVPDDYPLWTGSPPCQPFSTAGVRSGKGDERHLWPVFFRLIRQCRPAIVFGEQVESAIAHGWLDDLCADLEGEGYACGAAITPACGVGAPHIRQRLYWVADSDGGESRQGGPIQSGWQHRQQPQNSGDGRSQHRGPQPHAARHLGANAPDSFWSDADWLFCRDGKWRAVESKSFPLVDGLPTAVDGRGPISRIGTLRGFGNAIVPQVAAEFIKAVMP